MRSGFSPRRVAVLALMAWIGLVYWHYQRVQPPTALVLVVLGAVWVALVTSACHTLGVWLARLLRLPPARDPATLIITLAVGAGGWMAWAVALGVAGLLRPWALLLPAGIVALFGAPALVRHLSRLDLGDFKTVRLPALFVAAVGLVTFFAALTPSPFYDQLNYHLAFPERWLMAGRFVTFPRHTYSFLPANCGLAYVYGLAAVGSWGAQLVHWWLGVLATGAVGILGFRTGGFRRAWWSAAIFALVPSVMLMSTRAGNDLGVVAFALAAWLLAVGRLDGNHDTARWFGVGVLGGIAAGAKLSALTTALPALIVAAAWPGRKGLARRLALLALGCGLTLAPWMLRNLTLTGNPTFPLLAGIWARVGLPAAAVDQGVGGPLDSIRSLPHLVTLGTFSPSGDAGTIGPLILGLLPAAIWLAWRRRRRGEGLLGLAALVTLAGWAVGPLLGRYLIPPFAWLAPLLAAGVAGARAGMSRHLRPAVTVFILVGLTWNALTAFPTTEWTRLAITAQRASEDEFFERNASYWPAVRFVNSELPAQARVLLVAESRIFNLNREVVVEDPFQTPLLAELAMQSRSPEEIASRLRTMGVTHVLVNWHEARRVATMTGRPDYPQPQDARARERLHTFVASHLTSVYRNEHTEVLALSSQKL